MNDIIIYRNVQIAQTVKLYKKDGSFNVKSKSGLDRFIDSLEARECLCLSEYKGTTKQVLIDFKCIHGPQFMSVKSFLNGSGCKKCAGKCKAEAEKSLYKLVEQRGHRLVGKYINSKTPIDIDFQCGHPPHPVSPDNYRHNSGCPRCSKKSSTQAGEELYQIAASRGHKIIGNYLKSKTKITIDFNCGHPPQKMLSSTYKKGSGCRKCAGTCPEQAEIDFYNLIEQKGFRVIGSYVNAETKIEIDFMCGHPPHLIAPRKFKLGQGCAKCSGNDQEHVKREFERLVIANGDKQLSEYKGAFKKVLIDFNCPHPPYSISPVVYKRGGGCMKCAGTCPEEARLAFEALLIYNGHKALSPYIAAEQPVIIDFCCGHPPITSTPSRYKSGRKCPRCASSKGEKIIANWLEKREILYEREYNFEDLPRRYFDIYLSDYNLIIEIHGSQHFEQGRKTSSRSRTLKEEQANDEMKKQFVLSQGMNYMMIDYREHKPELALERFKKQFKGYLEENGYSTDMFTETD